MISPSPWCDQTGKTIGSIVVKRVHRGRVMNSFYDGCQHRLFFSKVEYCDNLIFRRRAAVDNLGERLIDANRTIGQPNKITVIFGRKISKYHRGKLQTEIENTSFEPRLRATTSMNGVNKSVQNLPALRSALSAINDNYLNVQQDILETFIDSLRQASAFPDCGSITHANSP